VWVGDNPDGKRLLRGWLVDVVSDSETKVHREGTVRDGGITGPPVTGPETPGKA
jgi:hypothetical protein